MLAQSKEKTKKQKRNEIDSIENFKFEIQHRFQANRWIENESHFSLLLLQLEIAKIIDRFRK